jgi:hypothetical protein
MRFFLCTFEDFCLAVPIDQVASLLLYSQIPQAEVFRDEEKGDVYFSLPHFFGSPGETVRHGLVLKEPEQERTLEERDRKILLVTMVERDENIPENRIQPLPGILFAMDGVSVITGICFVEGSTPILFVDPMRLIPCILNNEAVSAETAGERAG